MTYASGLKASHLQFKQSPQESIGLIARSPKREIKANPKVQTTKEISSSHICSSKPGNCTKLFYIILLMLYRASPLYGNWLTDKEEMAAIWTKSRYHIQEVVSSCGWKAISNSVQPLLCCSLHHSMKVLFTVRLVS